MRPAREATFAKRTSEHHTSVRFHASAATVDSVIRAKAGPWGDLEYYTVYLEATKAQLKNTELPTYDTEWNFVGYSDEQVTKLFEGTDMPASLRAELLDREKWRHHDKMVTVVPGNEILLGLAPEARIAIYSVLRRWEEDANHHEPVVIFAHSVREWLEHEDLPEEVVAAIEKTSYHRGKNLVFADTPLVLRLVDTEEERLKIRKALTRTPTLVVSLRVTPDTDTTAIADYWGGATPAKDILPFLESIADSGIPRSVDLAHLLPPTARRLLYTFPNPNSGHTGYYPDCHWTSLNFRNSEPLDRLADPILATAYVLQNYTKVQGPYRYGDVIFLMDGPTGNAIHSCVYLADDLVYTKNGRSPTQPWVVMKLDDVVTYYGMFYTTQVACYRHNVE
ncbi:MAG: hypothetical protein ABJF10_16270 [Chthoniobacter sp.]|uniref:hypothetical protein n=1 Tax=Chthoniobacter sp. TaxID=2510640 RepID=UPI0032AE2DDE